MTSKDELNTEPDWMAERLLGKVDSTSVKEDAKQEVTARSRLQRIRSRWCLLQLRRLFSLILGHWQCLLIGLALIIITAFVAIQTVTSHQRSFPHEQCPSEWIVYKSKCYFISEEEKDWTSSQTFCAKNKSLLAVFENQEEMHSLAKRLKIDDSWIGLRKKGENFYWENGVVLRTDLFQMRNHSECAYLEIFTIFTSACSLPRRWICVQIP